MRIYFDRKARLQEDAQAARREQLQLKDQPESETDDNQEKQGVGNHKQSNIGSEEASTGLPKVDNAGQISTNVTGKDDNIMTEIELSKGGRGDETIPLGSVHDHDGHSYHHHHHHHHDHQDSMKPHEIITKALKRDRTTPATSNISNPPQPNVPRKASDIAPVAWMIIIGDGLHNFIDGLSIGAAFTESIYQGMIICIAVIFEELPHELGDFAVLISSGMTVRQALGFNFLSACTCYIGMVFGIILGDTTQGASYIFALAAGMFFYISLVDMMGELSAALEECKHSTRESVYLLLMQNIGILSGILIIFSLSLFGPGG